MRVMLVEDEEIMRVSLTRELTRAGYAIEAHERPSSALVSLSETRCDVIVSDIRMPGMDGFAFLAKVLELHPDTSVIFMTAFGTVRDAVRAMRLGAFDYLTKPFEVEELVALLRRIRDLPSPTGEPQSLKRTRASQARAEELGSASSMRSILDQLPRVACSEEIVLIWGETGTGKEHLARLLHAQSRRADGPFLKVSCAALSPQLVESELFGHERGAFTGADRRRVGRFERAAGGSLMLDEVDDVPLALQVKLLEVLQDRAIERVGGDAPVPVDVRVIAATKANLEELVEQGKFRRDLFYRLNVIPLRLPPLRERREDIPALFARLVAQQSTGRELTLSPAALDAIVGYGWPGNVRELQNLVKRLLVMAQGDVIDVVDLPEAMRRETPNMAAAPVPGRESRVSYADEMARTERDLLEQALEESGGNRTRAALALGIPASTLRDKLAKQGLAD